MIHYAGYKSDDENLPEDPETELEFIEVPEVKAVILLPGDKKEKAREILSGVMTMANTLGLFPVTQYPHYTIYRIPGDNGAKKRIYMFPQSSSYEDMKIIMQGIRQAANIMGVSSDEVIIGIQE